MAFPDSPVIFLAIVALISLSGVIMPGPVFAATISKGYKDITAGLKIAAGHAVIEIPLIVAIFLGFGVLLRDQAVLMGVGVLGGALLVYMGIDMVRRRKEMISEGTDTAYSSFTAGVVTTAANPYFFLWWATVGAALIAGAVEFGWVMLPLFALVHIACDFAWEHFVAFSIFKSKGLWSERRHHLIFMSAGIIMFVFGVYFISSSVLNLV